MQEIMSETELMKKVSVLPENLKEEASDYVDFLISKYLTNEKSSVRKSLKFGMMKGTFKMSDDFDKPLIFSDDEDAQDLLTVIERRNEPTMPFEDFVAQLKSEGKLDA
jgi:hypothetical protein